MSNEELASKIEEKQKILDSYNQQLESLMDTEEGSFYGVYDKLMEDIDKTVSELQELINQIK